MPSNCLVWDCHQPSSSSSSWSLQPLRRRWQQPGGEGGHVPPPCAPATGAEQRSWVKASIQLWLLGTHLPRTPWTDFSSLHLSPLPPLHQCPPLCSSILPGAAPSLQPFLHEPTVLYFSSFSPFHVLSEDISCSPSLGGHQLPWYDYIGLPEALQGCNSSEAPGQFFPSWLFNHCVWSRKPLAEIPI